MADSHVHGAVVANAEHEAYDERRTLVRRSVRIMEDGTALIEITKHGDPTDVSTWVPSGRLGRMLNSSWSSGWKLAMRLKLPEVARTEQTARWILEHPERAATCRAMGDLRAQMHLHPLSPSVPATAVPPPSRKRKSQQTNDHAEPIASSVSQKTKHSPHGRPSRYSRMGQVRSAAKSQAARENGRRGGRPSKWSPEARATAAELLRAKASGKRTDAELARELRLLASALEKETVR